MTLVLIYIDSLHSFILEHGVNFHMRKISNFNNSMKFVDRKISSVQRYCKFTTTYLTRCGHTWIIIWKVHTWLFCGAILASGGTVKWRPKRSTWRQMSATSRSTQTSAGMSRAAVTTLSPPAQVQRTRFKGIWARSGNSNSILFNLKTAYERNKNI